MTGSGSASSISPLTGAGLPSGSAVGDGVVLELVTGGAEVKWNFRHENQLGSLIGMTDLLGKRTHEVDYGEYGQTYAKHILWDGPVDVTNTQSSAGNTLKVYTPLGFSFPANLENSLLRCVHPGLPLNPAPERPKHVTFGTVKDYGHDLALNQDYLIVEDLEGHVVEAIKEIGCDVTILANYGQVVPVTEPVTHGHWDDVSYDSMTDTTTFTDLGQSYPPAAVDWWLQPDAAVSVYLDILQIGTGTVIVAGNATGMGHGMVPRPMLPDAIGNFYTIVWPVGVVPFAEMLAWITD